MLIPHERRPQGCGPLGFGGTLCVVGVVIALIGCFWHYPPLTATTGVIVESRPLSARAAYDIVYEYEAFGVRHRGERVWRYASQFNAFYQVGAPFSVYFVTAHPEISYGPNRPLAAPIIVGGIIFAIVGSAIIFFAWPR